MMMRAPHPRRRGPARRLSLIALMALWALTAAPSLALATTLLKLDLAALERHSEQIVAGQIVRLEARQDQGRIFTQVTLRVERAYKGQAKPAAELTFRQLGGRLGDVATYVPGQPQFRVGEQVLLFLERPQPGLALVVTGMAQGKFSLTQAPDGTRYVIPALDGHTPLLERAAVKDGDLVTQRLRQSAPSTDHSQISTLSDFEDRLRRVMARPQTEGSP